MCVCVWGVCVLGLLYIIGIHVQSVQHSFLLCLRNKYKFTNLSLFLMNIVFYFKYMHAYNAQKKVDGCGDMTYKYI